MATQVQMITVSPLHRVFYADSLFEALVGLALIIDAEPIARLLGLTAPIAGIEAPSLLRELGFTVLVVAAILFAMARQQPIPQLQARSVAVLNAAWVIGSDLLLLLAWNSFSAEGRWIIILLACPVAVLAYLEWRFAQ